MTDTYEEIDFLEETEGANEEEQEEDDDSGVLNHVLEELDRERTRRAELELQVRKLTEAIAAAKQQQQQQTTKPAPTPPQPKKITQRDYMAMQTKVQEFEAVVQTLTNHKPAIAIAAAAARTTSSKQHQQPPRLSLEVILWLEVLPWSPVAQEHVVCKDAIYEWNYYDVEKQEWTSQLRLFPASFKNLMTIRPEQQLQHQQYRASLNSTSTNTQDNKQQQLQDRGLLVFLAGKNAMLLPKDPQQGVLSDEAMTCLYSMDQGYPLPTDGGTWEWIGGWRIEKRVVVVIVVSEQQGNNSANNSHHKKNYMDCDLDGWSYAQEPDYFIRHPTEWVWDNPGKQQVISSTFESTARFDYERKLRRRKWIRSRVLVDYPGASMATQEYLKLAAENARLTVSWNKISDQLVATKVAWTTSEETLLQTRSQARAEIAQISAEIQSTREERLLPHTTTQQQQQQQQQQPPPNSPKQQHDTTTQQSPN